MMDSKSIRLVRTDEEAEDIIIDVGEVVIGRGQLLGCTDKRVSRAHGMIILSENGDILLVSKHINPLFYVGKGKPLRTISSEDSVVLKDGDEFSLLPGSYQFRVMIPTQVATERNGDEHTEQVVVKNIIKEEDKQTNEQVQVKEELIATERNENGSMEEVTDKNIIIKEEEMSEQVYMKEDIIIKEEEMSEQVYMKEEIVMNEKNGDTKIVVDKDCIKEEMKMNEQVQSAGKIDHSIKGNINDSQNVDHIRILPSWMTGESDESVSSKNTNSTRKRKEKITKEEVDTKRPKATPRRGKKTAESSNIGESSNSDEIRTPQKQRNGKESDRVVSDSGANKTKLHELSDDEDAVGDIDINNTKLHELSDVEENDKANPGDMGQADDGTGAAAQDPATNNKRQKCMFGASCYRKNPQHRIDFSHPGDVDYDDDLPECPYGTACYRKNKQHRLDYKHTAPPQQTNKKDKKRPRPNYKDDSSEDDYDYDDPFLNDASSDDYQPTDSGSDYSAPSSGEDEEDTKRMLKEAKKFTRKKK